MKIIPPILFLLFSIVLKGQTPEGVWISIDDDSGEPTGHVEIFQKDDRLFGKVIKMLEVPEDPYCTKCKESDDRKDQHILGMEIMRNFERDGNKWFGKILDPENGKVYTSTISLEDPNTLKLRGYIGIQLLGRTQKWKRLKKID
jgi:uncharacterized protein (DUF2147 family)